jgi:hypothetical protein
MTFNVCQSFYSITFASSLLDDLKCLPADKVTYDHIWLNKSFPVPAGTFFQFNIDPNRAASNAITYNNAATTAIML